MADIKWIKLDVGIFADEKIKVVMSMPEGKSLVIIWLKILCLAGRINNSGVLMVNSTIPYTVEMLSAVFDESESIMRLAIDTFQRLGMIDQFNGALLLPNWEKHQSEDRLKEIQNQAAARVARHRERQRLKTTCNVTDTLQKRLCNAIEQEQEQEQDIEQELNKGNDGAKAPKPRKVFTPPTIDDVKAYCKERNNKVDPEHWHAHYTANGWMVGRNKMKDWKHAVITWEKNGFASRAKDNPSHERKIEIMSD